MNRPPRPSTIDSPGPRRPELTRQEVLAIADHLLARDRAQLSRLSRAGRLRRWGN